MTFPQKKEIYIICDNIRSLENIGSIFRSADAFRVAKIYLTGICGKPPHSKIAKTALGAEENIEWEYCKQVWRIIDILKKQKVTIVALEKTKNSKPLNKLKPKFPLAIVLGNEVRGISKSVLHKADRVIHIPMLGKKESLNVSVACGITLYSIKHK